jgi:uncharacterized protein
MKTFTVTVKRRTAAPIHSATGMPMVRARCEPFSRRSPVRLCRIFFQEPIMSNAENHHRVDYIEFKVASIAAAKAFYGQAFSWTFQDYGPDYCEFRDGRLTGGFAHGEPSPGGVLVLIYSTELEATLRQIEAAGGTIIQPIFTFPGGRRFHFRDQDGHELAVWSDH